MVKRSRTRQARTRTDSQLVVKVRPVNLAYEFTRAAEQLAAVLGGSLARAQPDLSEMTQEQIEAFERACNL